MGQGVYTALPMLLADKASLVGSREDRCGRIFLRERKRQRGKQPDNLRRAGALVHDVVAAARRGDGVLIGGVYGKQKALCYIRRRGAALRMGKLMDDARRLPLPDKDGEAEGAGAMRIR